MAKINKIGKLCPDCGNPMEMYYTLQCFHCKKPMPDNKDRGNLFKAMYWLRNNEPEFNKDRFMDRIIFRKQCR